MIPRLPGKRLPCGHFVVWDPEQQPEPTVECPRCRRTQMVDDRDPYPNRRERRVPDYRR